MNIEHNIESDMGGRLLDFFRLEDKPPKIVDLYKGFLMLSNIYQAIYL